MFGMPSKDIFKEQVSQAQSTYGVRIAIAESGFCDSYLAVTGRYTRAVGV